MVAFRLWSYIYILLKHFTQKEREVIVCYFSDATNNSRPFYFLILTTNATQYNFNNCFNKAKFSTMKNINLGIIIDDSTYQNNKTEKNLFIPILVQIIMIH